MSKDDNSGNDGKGFLEVIRAEDVNVDVLRNKGPDLVVVEITPEIARRMLDHNTGNRRLRKSTVNYLAGQIKRGEWQNNFPQPLVFDSDGKFIDGQHRLYAVIQASMDIPVRARVETGADPKVREYLDTGIPRSLDDRVYFVDDLKQNKIIAQIITFDWNLKRKQTKRPTPDEALAFFHLYEKEILMASDVHRNSKGVGMTAVAYAAMEYATKDFWKSKEFYSAIFIPDSDIQQARMLRDWLIRNSSAVPGDARTGVLRSYMYDRCVGCMKSHLEGRYVKQVRAAAW